MTAMQNRKTVRKYIDKNIEDSLLNELFSLASRSSNTGNMQAYSVIVTKNKDIKKQLSPFHFNQPQLINAPVVLTICADLNRVTKWAKLRKANPGFNNVQALTFATIDAIIFAQTFCVAAEEKGLGICYLGTTTYNAKQIADVLNLPDLVIPVTTITVGYPDESVEVIVQDRLPLEGFIHNEVYSNYSESDIDNIYGYKESLPESKKFIEINKKETLAQVYTDIRYKKEDNEFFSKEFIEAIRAKGFNF